MIPRSPAKPTAQRRLQVAVSPTRCAVLYPAIAEAAHRAGASAVGLIDVGTAAGLNTHVDRVGIAYDTGQRLGDPSSGVRVECRLVGGRPVPERAIPPVVSRARVDRQPLDAKNPDDVGWLRSILGSEQVAQAADLEAGLALARRDPARTLQGDPVELLPAALAQVPADALAVVITTWALSRLSPQRRRRFERRLSEASAKRAVAWVSAEGVGVAPGVPTYGDRPASGHSIIGLTVGRKGGGSGGDGSILVTEALGRCWSRGRVMAWLAAE